VTAEKKLRTMHLVEAGEIWLSGKISKGLKPKTLECCQGNLRSLMRFFGPLPLADFHAGSFKAYQQDRARTAGVSAINHELNVLQQILKRAGLWAPIADFYAPLPEPDWKPPKTFTEQEQELIFETAENDPNVELAEIVFLITRNTTASGCELRGLRLRNIELYHNPPRISIPPDSVKNHVRPRVIPLNQGAYAAFERAIERAHRLGSHRPEHYLFPFRVNRRLWDPTRPASKSWLRKQNNRLREATGIQHLRPHAFRHLAVTELLESGEPEQTVIAIAGWVSRNMINTYSHARIEAKAKSLSILDKKQQQRTQNDRYRGLQLIHKNS
jgi:integrase